MTFARIAPALGLVFIFACTNGGGNPSGDMPNDGTPPSEGTQAPGQTDAGDPPAGSGDDPTDDPAGPAPAVPADATPVEFKVIAPATQTSLGIRVPRRVVIRDAEAWQDWYDELYSHMTPRPPALHVDFPSRMVIAATMGQQYSGGHQIMIERIDAAADGTLYVTVLSASPGTNCVTTQGITSPAAAVELAASPGEPVFVERQIRLEC